MNGKIKKEDIDYGYTLRAYCNAMGNDKKPMDQTWADNQVEFKEDSKKAWKEDERQ